MRTCHLRQRVEMFIKVEEDGLYYFGAETDDTGSLSIAGEELSKKDGTICSGF